MYKISSWNMIFTQYPNDLWHLLPIKYIFGYYCKYTRATYDWFCGSGSHIL